MSKELVKLRRKAIDAIELMKAKGAPNNEIIERHINKDHIQVNNFDYVASLATETLIRALYIGYEIEETPEDKVRNYFEKLQRDKCLTKYPNDMELERYRLKEINTELSVIMKVVELLNIKIEGVNA